MIANQVADFISLALLVAGKASILTWAVAVCLLVVVYTGTRRFLLWRRLSHIPGPFWASLSQLWLLRVVHDGNMFEELGKVCADYGPIARVGPNYLIVGDPHELRRAWSVRGDWDRSEFFRGFQLDPPNDCSVSMRDNDLHASLRAKMAPGYSGKDVDGVHEGIDEAIESFVRLIEDKYLSTETEYRPVDLSKKINFLTLDVISKIAFGKEFGFVAADEDLYQYIATSEASVPIMGLIGLMPSLLNLLQSPILKALLPQPTDTVGLGRIMGIAKSVVANRYNEKKEKRRDMLGSFVEHGLSQREAEAESLVQILAGSDTTAGAIRTILLHVVTNPAIHAKLVSEIDAGVLSGAVSSPVRDDEARRMPYLQACIREGIRYWPPVTGLMSRVSRHDGDVCGVPVPAGTDITWSPRAVMRNTDVFGEDADVFRPERWINAGQDRRLEMESVVWLAFGQARWSCLGKPIAFIELNKVVVELLRRFDFAIVNVLRPVDYSFLGLMIMKNLNMRISKRTMTMV